MGIINVVILQYQEELCDLSEVAGLRPQRALVASIQQENRQLRELQQENRELRALLEEHQNALELIMSKYRQHISQLVKNSQIDFEKLAKKELAQVGNFQLVVLVCIWLTCLCAENCRAGR